MQQAPDCLFMKKLLILCLAKIALINALLVQYYSSEMDDKSFRSVTIISTGYERPFVTD